MSQLGSRAFETWDRADESLESTEQRIHDGVTTAKELVERGHWYINTLKHLFPYTDPQPGAKILDVGSGLGYIMQAANEAFRPSEVIGLDVAPSMIDKAKRRLHRDLPDAKNLSFLLYDGVSIPLPDRSIDYICSVAALQHVPKPFVFNLFFELKRILKEDGWCNVHLLSVNNIADHDRQVGFEAEIQAQIKGTVTHWHHFYAFDELLFFFADALKARRINIVDGETSIWGSFSRTGPVLEDQKLIRHTHLGHIKPEYAEAKLQSWDF